MVSISKSPFYKWRQSVLARTDTLPLAILDSYRYRAGIGCKARITERIKRKADDDDDDEADVAKPDKKKLKRYKDVYLVNKVS
jgi:hypothetical protein